MNDTKHLTHYFVLITGLLITFVLFLLFRNDPNHQLIIGSAGCLFYALWGIIHGLSEHRLNKHVAFEYISMSLFVFALIYVSLSLR